MDKRQMCDSVHEFNSTACNERAAKIQKDFLMEMDFRNVAGISN
jgi:hypothetical protein